MLFINSLTTNLSVKVINPKVGDDNIDYADADYKDLYVEGPKGYRKLPETKQKVAHSKENVNGL